MILSSSTDHTAKIWKHNTIENSIVTFSHINHSPSSISNRINTTSLGLGINNNNIGNIASKLINNGQNKKIKNKLYS